MQSFSFSLCFFFQCLIILIFKQSVIFTYCLKICLALCCYHSLHQYLKSFSVSHLNSHRIEKIEKPSPKKPPPPVTKVPVFHKTNSFTMDSSLDDIIKDQMKIATEEAQNRSRSSSVLSDTSGGSANGRSTGPVQPPRRPAPAKNYEPLKRLQHQINDSHSNEATPGLLGEKRVASSMFYSSTETSRQAVRPRPVPTRPALPPPPASGKNGKIILL